MSSAKPYATGFDEDPETNVRGECPECSGSIQTDGGERACTDCGLVIDGHGLAYGTRPRWFDDGPDTRQTGAPLTPARHDRGLSSEIGRGSDARGRSLSKRKRRHIRRLRREHNRARFRSTAEQNLAHACGDIARIVGALDLTHDVREFASTVFRRAQSQDLIKGRSLEGFSAASVFATCRCRGIPRSVTEIAAVARCDEDSVLNCYRVLNVELELEAAIQTPQHLLPRLCSELEVEDVVRRRARELTEVAETEGVANGRQPSGVAAAAIYLAAQEFSSPLTQAELADAADTTPVTLRERMHDIQEVSP